MKRVLAWILFLLFIPIIAVTWHIYENTHGRRAWEAWQLERQGKGDRYDWNGLIPATVPDSENFAKVPLIEAPIRGEKDEPLLGNFQFKSPEIMGDWKVGRPDDLIAWAKACGTQNMKTALVPVDLRLDEIAEASLRPKCNLSIHYSDMESPPLLGFRAAERLFGLRAEVLLQDGQTDAACKNVLAALRVSDHFKQEPSLIVYLLRLASVSVSLQPIWEGLTKHRWAEVQLKQFQGELAKIDLLESHKLAFQGKRLNQFKNYQFMLKLSPWRETENPWPDNNGIRHSERQGLYSWASQPKGSIYENLLNSENYIDGACLDPVAPERHRIDARRFDEWIDWPFRGPITLENRIAKITAPELAHQLMRMAQIQSGVDEAFIVCALERYRLAHKDYPSSLEALVPAYADKLPTDLFTGQTLRYQRKDKDHFILYSVGWNGTDDGGEMTMNGQERDLTKGDWPWPEPATH